MDGYTDGQIKIQTDVGGAESDRHTDWIIFYYKKKLFKRDEKPGASHIFLKMFLNRYSDE